jgi:dephospho-CoA kinase
VLKIALTGNIASGKSSVVEIWRGLGATVIEADELARRAVAAGSSTLDRIAGEWGPGILLPSGELDRAALRDVVFRDPAERKRLEQIVHPEVNRLREDELRTAEAAGLPIVVSDIPLLYEVGLDREYDVVVLVDAPEEIRRRRLVEQRGLDPAEAERMIAAQWPSERKRSLADYLIENRGSRTELEAEAKRVWSDLVARSGLP